MNYKHNPANPTSKEIANEPRNHLMWWDEFSGVWNQCWLSCCESIINTDSSVALGFNNVKALLDFYFRTALTTLRSRDLFLFRKKGKECE